MPFDPAPACRSSRAAATAVPTAQVIVAVSTRVAPAILERRASGQPVG
jgi:hypothetical protein